MLDSPLSNYFRLTERQILILKKFGLQIVRDLLWHFPVRYEGFAGRKAVADLVAGERASVHGRVIKTEAKKTFRKNLCFPYLQSICFNRCNQFNFFPAEKAAFLAYSCHLNGNFFRLAVNRAVAVIFLELAEIVSTAAESNCYLA